MTSHQFSDFKKNSNLPVYHRFPFNSENKGKRLKYETVILKLLLITYAAGSDCVNTGSTKPIGFELLVPKNPSFLYSGFQNSSFIYRTYKLTL